MSKQPARKHRETCGVEEPNLDHFADVKRALNQFLINRCPFTQKASVNAKARNERRKAGVNFDTQTTNV